MLKTMRTLTSLLLSSAILFSLVCRAQAAADAEISGVVRDQSGAIVSDATVSLLTPQQAVVVSTRTDAEGRFTFANIRLGSYMVLVSAKGFAEARVAANTISSPDVNLEIVLEPGVVKEEVTVTANLGSVDSVESISQQVNVIDDREIQLRAKTVLAQIANEEVGIALQRTSPTISGIVIRGVTGNKVNVFVDGIRYSTSAQRGGISTFLNLLDPSSLQAVEVLRGPNSAQYGSDALGGSIQILSRPPALSPDGSDLHGNFGLFFNSSDLSFGSNLTSTFATRNFGLLTNLAGRRVNTFRPGQGIDSHNAVTRFFDVSSDIAIDGRLPDTAFTQYGGLLKMNWSPAPGSQFIASYLRGQQDGGKRYDQLLGGDGTLIADLRNLMNDFFYVRYDKTRAGWLDGVTATYSFNSQREERVNQGGNGNPRASINHEFERINVNGVSAYANKLIGTRQNIVFGGDFYNERMNSPAFGVNPVSNAVSTRRPRVPDNALYRSGGVFVQDVWEVIPTKLRLTGNLRYSAASYDSKAADAPIVDGVRLWPDDSLRVSNVNFRVGAVVTPFEGFSLFGNVGSGFRAPHMTDLGALGLVGTGFEVSASEVAGLNAEVGSTADDEAVSTGLPVQQLEPETSVNYELGLRFYRGRVDTDLAVFFTEIKNNIVKQSLILPPGAVGQRLGSDTITTQQPNGVVFVEVASTPVLVRANFGENQIWGIEHTFDLKLTPDWSFGSILTYVHTQDKNGTPAPDAWLKLRYAPAGRRFWIEPYMHAAYRQTRLSSIDLADRRTGARRTAGSISAFFLNGATARGLVSPGPDATFGTADDFLIATGETLSQIQGRVLGSNLEPSSLFRVVPGYVTLNVRGGMRLGEKQDLMIEFENIADRNYRGVDWGVDGPGRGVYMRYNVRF